MKIAILAWGSLVGTKPNKKLSIGPWRSNGPVVPLEFSRISQDDRLTPVIDEKNGEANRVSYTISKCRNIKSALEQYRKYEGVNLNRIGVISLKDAVQSEACQRHPAAARAIIDWAKKNKIDAVIYCALGTRFKDKIDVQFTPANAVNYINGLDAKKKKFAVSYVRRVAKRVKTPFTKMFLD